jgi:GDPmannose 4,6-dehydratase
LGIDTQKHVETDPQLFRPAEVDLLCGDASKAARVLGWKPDVSFAQLVDMMVDADMDRVRHESRNPAHRPSNDGVKTAPTLHAQRGERASVMDVARP